MPLNRSQLLSVLLGVLAFHSPAPAQDKKPVLRWLGQSFFVLETSKGTKIAFDPHAIEAFGRPVARADLVLISHPHPDHTRMESIENRVTAKVLEGVKMAGEGGRTARSVWNPVDETFRDVKVRNVGVFHDSSQGALRGRNSVFIVEFDGLTLAHLGDLGHQLSEEQLRQIGPVDILLVPVGGVYTLNGDQAKRVVTALKPRRFVLPMHYGNKIFDDVLPADEFLEGQTNVKRMPTTNELTLDPATPAPKEPTIIVLAAKKE